MIDVKYRKKKFHKKKDFGCVTTKFTWSSARKSNHLRGTANNGYFPLCIVLHNLHNQITWQHLAVFSSSTPKSDWHIICPYKIKDTRIMEQLKKLLTVKQILLVSTLGMYEEQYGEYTYWC